MTCRKNKSRRASRGDSNEERSSVPSNNQPERGVLKMSEGKASISHSFINYLEALEQGMKIVTSKVPLNSLYTGPVHRPQGLPT